MGIIAPRKPSLYQVHSEKELLKLQPGDRIITKLDASLKEMVYAGHTEPIDRFTNCTFIDLPASHNNDPAYFFTWECGMIYLQFVEGAVNIPALHRQMNPAIQGSENYTSCKSLIELLKR